MRRQEEVWRSERVGEESCEGEEHRPAVDQREELCSAQLSRLHASHGGEGGHACKQPGHLHEKASKLPVSLAAYL